MRMYVSGAWVGGAEVTEVRSPYDGSLVDTVPSASAGDVEGALEAAVRGAVVMRALPAFHRAAILRRTAELLAGRVEELARTITLEAGKTIREARLEASRAVETLTLSGEEAKRVQGEALPIDAAPGGDGKLGLTIRIPCGVVLAISPFNFPLNLVAHKVGPALAAGNAVILKPATNTPLSALKLTELLLEAGLPEFGIQCLTGPGGTVGNALAVDRRVRKITFTGSRDVGEAICRAAGLKRVTMELGSNAPLIVMPDADLEQVAAATASSGYGCAGQVCISTQRVLVDRRVYADFLNVVTPLVRQIGTGDPLEESVAMGPMIRESEAARVGEWVDEAVEGGARILAGGERHGSLYAPTLIADVAPTMRISREELFGPAVAVTPVTGIDEAVEVANDSRYGLAAGIFTRDLATAMTFVRRVDAGNLMVNWAPNWRADLMPYGGLRDSGLGKEGPRYAVQEMTEVKTVIFH